MIPRNLWKASRNLGVARQTWSQLTTGISLTFVVSLVTFSRCKNLGEQSIPSGDIDDERKMQSTWTRAFWSAT